MLAAPSSQATSDTLTPTRADLQGPLLRVLRGDVDLGSWRPLERVVSRPDLDQVSTVGTVGGATDEHKYLSESMCPAS